MTLVKEEPRVAVLFWFFILAGVAIVGFECLLRFTIISRSSWPLAEKVFGLLRFAALADALVLATTLWGARHSFVFSKLDRILTHLPMAAVGLALMGFASYAVLTKPLAGRRPTIDLADAGVMWAGSFLFFWVFLFYGRKRRATAA